MAEIRKSSELNMSWMHSRTLGRLLFVGYVLVAVSPLVLAWLIRPRPGHSFLLNLALACAMVGFALVVLQVVLTSRFRWIDYPFGLDVVTGLHQKAGPLATGLLIVHPILLMIDHGSLGLLSLDVPWSITLGKIALIVLIFGVLFAMYFWKLKTDYNVWRFMHKGMVFVVLFGFAHSAWIGPDMEHTGMYIYWWGLFLIAAGIFTYRNLAVPIWIRRRFDITDVQQQSHDTYTLTFEPKDGRQTRRNPGQFMFVKFQRPGRPSELHPFTISASPLKTGILQATIKQSGNFTDTIDKTKPGDRARIEAPYGRFSLVHDNPEKVLFIAGGVGITPCMSMLRYLSETEDDREVVLIYANDTEQDILFRDELEQLPDRTRVVHVLKEPPENWSGEKGYVTKEIIEKYAGEILGRAHAYVCGPPAMMDKIIASLNELKVPDKRIHFERFSI